MLTMPDAILGGAEEVLGDLGVRLVPCLRRVNHLADNPQASDEGHAQGPAPLGDGLSEEGLRRPCRKSADAGAVLLFVYQASFHVQSDWIAYCSFFGFSFESRGAAGGHEGDCFETTP